jgi:hypothetical protein
MCIASGRVYSRAKELGGCKNLGSKTSVIKAKEFANYKIKIFATK